MVNVDHGTTANMAQRRTWHNGEHGTTANDHAGISVTSSIAPSVFGAWQNPFGNV
jgi:hypothetical protein